MVINSLIGICGNKISVKKIAVSILCSTFPLSCNDICHRIRKQGMDVRYHAVHKALVELLDEGVLAKENKEYRLSKKWIQDVISFKEKLDKNYQG